MDPGLLFIPPLLLTLLFFARLARTHWLKDRFLERLYADHRDIWESLGRPCGWQWSPPGRMATPWSAFSIRWEWFRSDPDWLASAPELRDLFRRVCAGVHEWNLRAMPIMVVLWVIFGLLVTYLQRHQ